jgi:cephalosporin hydroxylase
MRDEILMEAINEYHRHYEKAKIWDSNSWMGVPCWKLPMDAFIIQELIVRTKPDFILETGTGCGGSAMFYASICELMDHGKVITIDIEKKVSMDIVEQYKWSERVEFIHGGSTNLLVADKIVKRLVEAKPNIDCMVILDSWHTKDHVYEEMFLYKELVPVDGYMIIEDSHAAGNPVPWKWDDEGPMGAINKFLETENHEWTVDYSCEKHLLTFNPSGYLRRIRNG